MRIFTPNECKDKYEIYKDGRHIYPVIEASNGIWSDKLDDIFDPHHHNSVYVEEALDLITWPDLEYVKDKLEIYVSELPSRDHYNGSACFWEGVGTIFLYGRSTPVPRHMTHYIMAHEIGHIVQSIYCDTIEKQNVYKRLRRATESPQWSRDWRELFAEDFRWLFSIESAHQETWGTDAKKPTIEVAEYMLALIDYHTEDL